MNGTDLRSQQLEKLSEVFGDFRAEWLKERLFDLFEQPYYFPKLTGAKPCVLIGGRGTGKTTVLRGLSYEGQYALNGRDAASICSWPYYGFYYRVNTSRVSAFEGPELPLSGWERLFSHYINLLVCSLVLQFLGWYEEKTGCSAELGDITCRKISRSLNLDEAPSMRQLAEAIDFAFIGFEAYVNNVADGNSPKLSTLGAPIDILLEAISSLSIFSGKDFFFLIDEYENFSDYQQMVVNTLVKHCGHLYSFKIVVRELGWRVKYTLGQSEQLISPADYVLVDINQQLTGETFSSFALKVCKQRLNKIDGVDVGLRRDIRELLPGITEDEEAERLGVREAVTEIREQLLKQRPALNVDVLDDLEALKIYLIGFWAQKDHTTIGEAFDDYLSRPEFWQTRYGNYKYALLYTLRKKRGINKYFSGWQTFTQIAAGNIRFLLQLVDQSLMLHVRKGGNLAEPIPPEVQTNAAQIVGSLNLKELEGLAPNGGRMKKLLLGLGRIFGVLAARSIGHAPEIDHFYIENGSGSSVPSAAGEDEQKKELYGLLNDAVMHLALVRTVGSKLTGDGGYAGI